MTDTTASAHAYLQERLDAIRREYTHRPITRRLLENLLAEVLEDAIKLRQAGRVNQLCVAVRRARDDDHMIDVWVGEPGHPDRPRWTRSRIDVLSGETQ